MYLPTLLFIFDSPTQIVFVVAIAMLLFGGKRLPELARSLGQSKKAFAEALREGEMDEAPAARPANTSPADAERA